MGSAAELDRLLTRRHELDAGLETNAGATARLTELRVWQSRRLEATYAALRREPRYVAALEFFLSDLYGGDSGRRDDELKRAASRLRRALPAGLLEVLCRALELQVLTLELDLDMAARLAAGAITATTYAAAYRAVGRSNERKHQIELLARIGEDLAELVRQRWMSVALHAAHLPARAAGLGVLQSFLERGFHAFQQMGDPRELLAVIRSQETDLMEALLRGDDSALSNIRQRTVVNGRS